MPSLCRRMTPLLLPPLLCSLWTVLRPVAKKAEERFKRWTKPVTLLEGAAADLLRTKPELIAENALLRQQLIVLERQVKHPTFTPLDRGLLVMLASRLPHWKQALLIVKPETLLKWHRRGFKLFWRHKSQGQARQPRIDEETIALIKRMAVENRRWGTKRIRGCFPPNPWIIRWHKTGIKSHSSVRKSWSEMRISLGFGFWMLTNQGSDSPSELSTGSVWSTTPLVVSA